MYEVTPEIFGEMVREFDAQNIDEWETKPVTFNIDGSNIVVECENELDAKRVLYAMIVVASR